ncbi:MAG: hypothetical protein ACOX21_08855 [Bacillota bacterium]|jgi:hypothetical protein|nr:hypothetical protein [Bacillota bacterium]
MRKLVLAALAVLLLFPLTISGSDAYFSDATSTPVNIAADPDSAYFLLLISPEGASESDYASVESTGINELFESTIILYRPAAHGQPLAFNLGTITNKSNWPMDVEVVFEGKWPSQGASQNTPRAYTLSLAGNESTLFNITFDRKINNGTPDQPKGGGEYGGSILFTVIFYPPGEQIQKEISSDISVFLVWQ